MTQLCKSSLIALFLYISTSECCFCSSLDLRPTEVTEHIPIKAPTDIADIPDALAVDADDTITPQSEVLKEIIGNALPDPSTVDDFDHMHPRTLKLSKLKTFYENKDKNVLSLLKHRHKISVDDEFTLKMGVGQIYMDTNSSMVDFHLTIGNCLGLSPLLPNSLADPQFTFAMDLHMQYRDFKCKNAMLGFDPVGRMLYIGRCRNEDIFLAMAPNQFLRGHFTPTPAGRSTGSSVMSTRHYRQTVMMFAHFLAKVSKLSFYNNRTNGEVYDQSLDSPSPHFSRVTDVM